MFCTKLKELKISGECPFSSSVKTNQLEHSEQPSTDAAHFPTSKDVHRNTDEDAPHQKSSRAKVNLHTLGESIRKLACPEVRKKNYTTGAILRKLFVSSATCNYIQLEYLSALPNADL